MKRESREWIKIAEEDLLSAECLFTFSLYRMVCYHAQQAVEKILKATLTEHEAEVSRIHNILDLCNAIEKIGHKAPPCCRGGNFSQQHLQGKVSFRLRVAAIWRTDKGGYR